MKKRKLMNLKVTHAENGLPLIQFLANRLSLSRNKAKEIIDQRRVFINGRRVWMARHRLKSGDQITGSFSVEKSADIRSANILYEDRDYLIINKPAGISSNGPNSVEQLLNRQSGEAPRGRPRGNLLRRNSIGYVGRVFARLGGASGEAWAESCEAKNAILSCHPVLHSRFGDGGSSFGATKDSPCREPQDFLAKKGNESAAACHEPRVACHRLDKDTSGCLIFAKSAKAKERIITLFVRNKIAKKYEAIIRGRLPKETMTIAAPIDGLKAITHIRLLDATPSASPAGSGASHVLISIETGRTHQIRKHLASIGHPVLGDQCYGIGREVPQSERSIGRQMLHAVEIKFIQPFSGLSVYGRAPLPADIKDCLQQYHLK